jgi:hydrogen cyanide synthase HcnB
VKTQRILPGRRILLAGTGPLLLVTAEVLLNAGVKNLNIIDSAGTSFGLRHVPALLNIPSLCFEALRLKWLLFKSRTPVYNGWGIVEARGKERVGEVVCAPFNPEGLLDTAQKKVFEVDTVIVGYGLLSRTEAVRLLGCNMFYDQTVRDYIPSRNDMFETSVEGTFAVGDGARVAGRQVAREEGKIAALAVAERMGLTERSSLHRRVTSVRAKLKKLYQFRHAVDELYALPEGLFVVPDDNTIVCRCEEVTAGEIRAVAPKGKIDLNDIKRRIRPGSGWCQGRICGPITAEMLAWHLRLSPKEIFRMTPRPPSKPIPLSMLIDKTEDVAA